MDSQTSFTSFEVNSLKQPEKNLKIEKICLNSRCKKRLQTKDMKCCHNKSSLYMLNIHDFFDEFIAMMRHPLERSKGFFK